MRRSGLLRRVSLDGLILAVVLGATAAVVISVRGSMEQIREGLPMRVLEQAGDVDRVVQDFSRIVRRIDQSEGQPLDESARAALVADLHRLEARLQLMRRTYNFDNLIGASALHAIMYPALQDMGRWLDEGAGGRRPGSAQTMKLVQLRADGVLLQLPDVLEGVNHAAQTLLRRQSNRLAALRDGMFVYLALFALFAVGILVLLMRVRVAENVASLERQRLVDSIESIDQGFALYDAGGALLLSNSRFDSLSSELAAAGRALDPGPARGAPEIAEHVPAPGIDDAAAPAANCARSEVETPSGRTFRIDSCTTGHGGRVTLHTEITDLKRIQRRLQSLAVRDPLTSLYNRNYLEPCLTQSLARAGRRGQKVAVMFLDIDRFKTINDTLGHARGDELLRRIAGVLRHCMREGDSLVRTGGDEFVAVLEPIERRREAAIIARRILDGLSGTFDLADRQVSATMSIGIAMFPDDGTDPAALLESADVACYDVKEAGRNHFRFCTAEMNARAVGRRRIEHALDHVLDRDELEVHYQPIFDVASQSIVAFEALLRWNSPSLGAVAPSQFIPVAEESGHIAAIGKWVLEQACTEVGRWRDRFGRDLRVTVNLSARQVCGGDLVRVVTAAIERARLDPAALILELTESLVIRDIPTAVTGLQSLHDIGVGIWIDDFGVGHSTLAAIKRLPLTAIKVDRMFMRDIAADSADRVLVEGVAEMAHRLGMIVVAEGVETAEQLDAARELGCDAAQGFLLGRPAGVDTTSEMLARSALMPAGEPAR